MTETDKHDLEIFRDAIDRALAEPSVEEPRPRADRMRSSSLPYCGLRELYEWGAGLEKPPFDGQVEGYLKVGTAVHELLQARLPRHFEKVEVMGRWKPDCREADCPLEGPAFLDRTGCPKCGVFGRYGELDETDSPSPSPFFTSHVDGIWRVKGTGRAWIIDYKTTSSWTINAWGTGKIELPWRQHVWQLDSYAVQFKPLLEEMDLELAGTMVLYVSRNKITENALVVARESFPDEGLEKLDRVFERMSRSWVRVGEARRKDRPDAADFADLRETKTCRSRDFYDKHFDSPWSTCPLADVCFDPEALRERLKEAAS